MSSRLNMTASLGDVPHHSDSAVPCSVHDDSTGDVASELSLLSDIESLSASLGEKFEEIRMIHDLTARLELQDDPSETCQELLEQLIVCVTCETLIIQLDPDDDDVLGGGIQGIGKPIELSTLDNIVLAAMDENGFGSGIGEQPSAPEDTPDTNAVAKRRVGDRPDWQKETVIVNHSSHPDLADRRVVLMPIARGSVRLGRLIAIRNSSSNEFGTIEVDLMRSVLMVLALHLMNKRQFNEMQSMLEGTVRSLASALDAKDAYTHGHSSRVADLAVQLALRLGLGDRSAESLQLAGILHDIGKIGIDDSVLKKPGSLTAEEFDQIKRHPVLGYEILKDIRPFRHILPAVRHHHESWDGGGYPDGLAGDEIPRDAQILAVADAFDAMISDRPYRRGMPLEKVREIFQKGRGQQWAADVVDALLQSHDLMLAYAEQRPFARPDLQPQA
ncbi:HD-GYP domain-containing protein [Rhodopirellula sp. SWK7]|uniref:HD-GYP domain-containing protein n=1 Tax=Rhodopirellula sp. SWK7 TaxID=595460 RepID=UPI0002BDCEE9|nr:HD-GYP domain-containing protein [Rhodopirellula sp. SWK7]EMI47335.1 Metal-dependent phosphohydrolase, HD region, subdomain protein domain protein [Rhodopirellula sp. SWK7]